MRHSTVLLCFCAATLLSACLIEEVDLCNQPNYPWECTCPDAQEELRAFDYYDEHCDVCKSTPDNPMCSDGPPPKPDAGADAGAGRDGSAPEDSATPEGDAGADAEPLDGGPDQCSERCEGSMPNCDVETGSCEVCNADGHCATAGATHCVAHACVECRAGEAADCAASGVGPVCVAGACEQCASHPDCKNVTRARCDSAHACVPCNDDDQCTGRVNGAGDPLTQCVSGVCVECENHADCTDPAKAMCNASNECVPCDDDIQCAGREDSEGDPIEVCDAGACVECTGLKYAACLVGGTQYVCDSLQRTCSDKLATSAFACQPCVSDAQCVAGHLCMKTKFGSVDTGLFCLWRQDATEVGGPNGDCTSLRQYRAAEPTWTSLDAVGAVPVCRSSVTTCQGQNDFQVKTCDAVTAAGDAQCGAPNADDAYCAPFGAGNRCTVPCIAFDDCKNTRPDDLECQPKMLSAGNIDVCAFN